MLGKSRSAIGVTAEHVNHGKPAPDLFLKDAYRLHAASQRCLVFEDSDEVLAAAKAAGMDFHRRSHAVDSRGEPNNLSTSNCNPKTCRNRKRCQTRIS